MPFARIAPAVACTALALAIAPSVSAAGGASATVTPNRVKAGQTVTMLVKGMQPRERVRAFESGPQGRTVAYLPKAGGGGVLQVQVKGQVKGKHTWYFTGRSSKRTAHVTYFVR
jgi:hypothetical protein